MKKKLLGAIALLGSLTVGFAAVELMLIGAVFLALPHTPTTTQTCDEVQQIEGQWYCLGKMHSPSDDVQITRNE